MRRTPKPFAVEVRRGGRTIKSRAFDATPSIADLIRDAEQPRVTEWPGIDEKPIGSPQTLEVATVNPTTGRILPVLNEPEPRAAPKKLNRRHWPAVPGLTIESRWPEDDEVAATIRPAATIDPETDGLRFEAEHIEAASAVEAKMAPSSQSLREIRSRVLRDAFRREERWMARLPAVVHRRRKRGD